MTDLLPTADLVPFLPPLGADVLATTPHERALMIAQARLDRARELARSAEADLDGQLAAVRRARLEGEDPAGPFDPDDSALLERVHAELLDAHAAAHGRSRRSAEKRVLALELAQRLILERLGCATFEEYRARRDATREATRDTGRVVIDLAYLEFAREELERAQLAWAELSASRPLPARRRPSAS